MKDENEPITTEPFKFSGKLFFETNIAKTLDQNKDWRIHPSEMTLEFKTEIKNDKTIEYLMAVNKNPLYDLTITISGVAKTYRNVWFDVWWNNETTLVKWKNNNEENGEFILNNVVRSKEEFLEEDDDLPDTVVAPFGY